MFFCKNVVYADNSRVIKPQITHFLRDHFATTIAYLYLFRILCIIFRNHSVTTLMFTGGGGMKVGLPFSVFKGIPNPCRECAWIRAIRIISYKNSSPATRIGKGWVRIKGQNFPFGEFVVASPANKIGMLTINPWQDAQRDRCREWRCLWSLRSSRSRGRTRSG